MTVTRKQAEPNDNALTHRPNDGITTSEQSQPQFRTWMEVAVQIAQDKRHNLAPEVVKFWMKKLNGVDDALICEALMCGKWEFFPSVDQVLNQIELIQEQRRQAVANRDWENYQAMQKYAEENGLLATDADYEAMRRRLRELFGDPSAKQKGARNEANG